MKRFIIFAAFAALVSLASCQKEGTDKVNTEKPVFTALISGDARTTVDASTGVVSWELNDEVTITDNSSKTAVYEVTAISSEGNATLTYKSGATLSDVGPYTATYGSQPESNQVYSTTPGKLYMTASSDTKEFTFTVGCGLLKLYLQSKGQSISSVTVSNSTSCYGLICNEPVSIDSGAYFYLALPAGTYTLFIFSNTSGLECVKTPSIVITANKIKPVTSSSISFGDTTTYPESGTPGVKIGNTWWAPVNCGYSKSKPNGLFYQWGRKYGQSTTGETEVITTQASSMAEGSDPDKQDKFYQTGYECWFSGSTSSDTWLSAYDPCPAGWRVPTKEEFANLTACSREWKTGSTSGETGYLFGTSPNQVFFSAPGERHRESGSVISVSTSGYYWSSSPDSWYASAKYLFFNNGTVQVGQEHRAFGCSVRCVK